MVKSATEDVQGRKGLLNEGSYKKKQTTRRKRDLPSEHLSEHVKNNKILRTGSHVIRNGAKDGLQKKIISKVDKETSRENLLEEKRRNPKEHRREKVMKGRGVIYLGHIPNGFYEPQIRRFFSQFGKITRLIMPRSKKSGRSRGYAYVEFELEEVARIAAEALNNFRVFGKTLVCNFVASDEVQRRGDIFKNCHRKFRYPSNHAQFRKTHNEKPGSPRKVKSCMSKRSKTIRLVKGLGLDFDVDSVFTFNTTRRIGDKIVSQGNHATKCGKN